MTPDGIKRDADVAPEQSIAPQTARRMDRMIMAVLALALVFFDFDRLVLAPRRDAALVATTSQTVRAETLASAQAAVSDKSIGVLAFANMSADKDNEYFSDGIAEEILNSLSKIKDLRVAGRTSSSFTSMQATSTAPNCCSPVPATPASSSRTSPLRKSSARAATGKRRSDFR